MGALATRVLPRLRIRRMRPRPPWWWYRLVMCLVAGLLATVSFAVGVPVTGAGCALLCGSDWRRLVRWEADSLSPPIDATTVTLDVGGIALCVAGLFV